MTAPPISRQRAMQEVAQKYLFGRGFEIGAGDSPFPNPNQADISYVDNIDAETAAERFGFSRERLVSWIHTDNLATAFPGNADFLVTSNVLEHTPDPVGTLMDWMRHLKPNGRMIVAVPCVDACQDAGRLVADFQHVALDHLLKRGEHAFETREHVYSMQLAWSRSQYDTMVNVHELANGALNCAKNLFTTAYHYHAFDAALLRTVIHLSAYFSGHQARILEVVTHDRTGGDIVAVVDIDRSKAFSHGPTRDQLMTLRHLIHGAVDRLPTKAPLYTRWLRALRRLFKRELALKDSTIP